LEDEMRNVLTNFVGGIAITLLVNIGQANAGIIVSNLSATVNGEGEIHSPPPNDQWYGQEFTTGSQSVELGTVIVPLGDATGTFTPFAELLTDNSNSPGSTALTNFTVPSIGTSVADLTLTPTSSVLLSANTSYWFVLGATGSGIFSYKWQFTNTADPYLPNFAYTRNDGLSWTTFVGAPFLIQVNSVPEPSSFVLSGLASIIGFGALMVCRSRPIIAKWDEYRAKKTLRVEELLAR
jgi:hypothetical protein